MKRKTRRNIAAFLAFFLLFQLAISITAYPIITFSVYAEEEEEEERGKPRPGVRNADDRSNRTTQGSPFPSGGTGSFLPFQPSPNSNFTGERNNGGRNGAILDPIDRSTNPALNDNDNTRNDSEGNTPQLNNGLPIPNGEGPEQEGTNPETNGGNPEQEGNSPSLTNGENGSQGNDDEGNNPNKEGNSDGTKNNSSAPENNGGSNLENGTRNNDTDSGRDSSPENSPLDTLRSITKGTSNTEKMFDLMKRLENNESLNSGDWLFLLSMLKISDDEDIQKGYETLISQMNAARGVGNEIRDTQLVRNNSKPAFRDWFRSSTYTDTLFTHTREALSDSNYRTDFGKERRALTLESDSKKWKFSSAFTWAGDKVRSGLNAIAGAGGNIGASILSALDRSSKFFGNSVANMANGVHSFLSNRLETVSNYREIFGHAKDTRWTAMQPLFRGAEKVAGGVERGMKALVSGTELLKQGGQWLANSGIGKATSSLVTSVKNFGTNMWNSGANLVNRAMNSTAGQLLSKVANSPIGKLGGTFLSGLSIYTGFQEFTNGSNWTDKTAGFLTMGSGVLGVAAVAAGAFAATAFAAPVLIAGSLVLGIGALAFTYGPKLVSKWNNSKFGSAVNNTVSSAYNATKEGVKAAANTVKNVGSNIINGISSGISGLFGRG